MNNVVYVDVLFLENFFMNYLLLYFVNRFCRCSAKVYKLLLSSAAGALYIFVIFYPSLQMFTSIIIKIVVSLIMLFIAFSPCSIKAFIKLTIIFYIEAFCIGGCTLGIYYLGKQASFDPNIQIHISPEFFITSILIALLLIKLGFDYFDNYFRAEKNKIELQILLDKKECTLTALIDTGNSLKDPLTNLPVVIVYFKAIYGILPDNFKNRFEHNGDYTSIMEIIMNSSLKPRIRLLPFKALGTENGLLTGIKIDMIIARTKNKAVIISNPVIALYDKPISIDDDYQALAYPEILKGDCK
jgi:stage II sporulation protein GA (sporulation sigma-E factor processing peptidase)